MPPEGCTKDMGCAAALGRDTGIHALNASASVTFWVVLYSLTSPGDRGRSKSETEQQPTGKGLMLLTQLELATKEHSAAAPVLHVQQLTVCSTSGEKQMYLRAGCFGITCEHMGNVFSFIFSP